MTTSPADRASPRVASSGRPSTDRDGACICDYNPDTTDGPQEDCPFHGRPYGYWVEGYDALSARVAQLEADLAAAEARLRAVEVIEADHRREWADYIERWEGAVGPKPPSVRMIVALLRSPYPPFGCSAATPPQPAP